MNAQEKWKEAWRDCKRSGVSFRKTCMLFRLDFRREAALERICERQAREIARLNIVIDLTINKLEAALDTTP